MIAPADFAADHVDLWLRSGQPARIAGFDLRPMPHPLQPQNCRCIVKGQAAVYFLRQQPHGREWLLKKFRAGRRPTDTYLVAADACLPSGTQFFTCMQRRVLTAQHLDLAYSQYQSRALSAWLQGTVLMPKVPGLAWAALADDLRCGTHRLTQDQRRTIAYKLARCIVQLEAASCCHRDLSAGNVFVDGAKRVYLIDWDSLYHTSLPFQTNTTAGTLGYAAPFTRDAANRYAAELSWKPCVDRYSLAILIAEILLLGPDRAEAMEDGALFSQAQLENPDGPLVQKHIDDLWRFDRRCGLLLWRALHARSFAQCPSPDNWCHVLGCDNPIRYRPNSRNVAGRRVPAHHPASERPCICEHCHTVTTLQRNKLNALRAKGSPLLCPACLRTQLEHWKTEQALRRSEYIQAFCARCNVRFSLRTTTFENLTAGGHQALCGQCRATSSPDVEQKIMAAIDQWRLNP